MRFRLGVYFFILGHELAHLMSSKALKWLYKILDNSSKHMLHNSVSPQEEKEGRPRNDSSCNGKACGKGKRRLDIKGTWRVAKVGTKGWELLMGCFPCCSIFGLLDPQVVVSAIGKDRGEQAVAYAIVEWAGVVASLIMAWACTWIKSPHWCGMASAGYFVSLFCMTSDYVSLFSVFVGLRRKISCSKYGGEQALWRFRCGNFGLLVAGDGVKDDRIDCIKILWVRSNVLWALFILVVRFSGNLKGHNPVYVSLVVWGKLKLILMKCRAWCASVP